MIGTALHRKRVRAFSRAFLVFYVAVLTLLAFGHTCGWHNDAADSTAGIFLPGLLSNGTSAAPHADHSCLACDWQAATITTTPVSGQPRLLRVRPAGFVIPHPLVHPSSVPLHPVSRGPPTS